jgi:hypothetical protein
VQEKLFHSILLKSSSSSDGVTALPSDEVVIEILEQCWISLGKSTQRCGVLLCTTHRLIFIEYPDSTWICRESLRDLDYLFPDYVPPSVSQDAISLCSEIFVISLAEISNIYIRRFYRNTFHALETANMDGTSVIFQFRRDGCNEMKLFEKFRRIKCEVFWLKEEDCFAFSSLKRNVCCGGDCETSRLDRCSGAQHRMPVQDGDFVPNMEDCTGHDSICFDDRGYSFVTSPDRGFSFVSVSATEQIEAVPAPVDDADNDVCSPVLYERDMHQLNEEYKRLLEPNIVQRLWRVSKVNVSFALCSSYPPLLIVPNEISDENLQLAATERSINRVPALTWIHPITGAALSRASQPVVGINVAACPYDEQLLMSTRAAALSLRHMKQAEADLLGDDGNSSEDEFENCQKAEERVSVDQSGTWTEVPALKKRVSRQRSIDQLNLASPTMISPSSSNVQLGSNPTSSPPLKPDLSMMDELSSTSAVDFYNEKEESRGNLMQISDQISVLNRDKPEVNASVIGGLMQGFAGTQSLVLRDAQYHRLKLIGLTEKRAKLSEDLKSVIDYQPRTKLRIIDARPLISAKGNVLMGKGHEVIDRLGGARCTSMEYAGIANIHGVKDSYSAMRKACAAASCVGRSVYENWLPELHESRWLQHIGSIMFAATCTAVNLNNGDPGKFLSF